MPPKAAVSQQALLDAAFELVRAEGADALSARRLAQILGCSTQPVYTACGSMERLKAEIAAQVKAFIERRLDSQSGASPPFLRIGLASLRLARDEPHLFRLASDHIRSRLDSPPTDMILAAMRGDPRLKGLDDARLGRIHAQLWIFAQGLATLVEPGAPDSVLARLEDHLRRAGEAIIEYELRASSDLNDVPSLNPGNSK